MNKMNKEPLISILMNCFNGEKFLKIAIDSVYEQTYQNWEIIFWDNGSTDNTSLIIKDFIKHLTELSKIYPLFG